MKRLIFTGLLVLIPGLLLAHGEDKLGPNGGYIRMPGGFHTEVKIAKDDLLVHLIDINFKNPTTKNSSVRVEYVLNGKTTFLTCSVKGAAFSCSLPKDFNAKKGKLVVSADREGMKGANAEYALPLQLAQQPKQEKDDPHAGHH